MVNKSLELQYLSLIIYLNTRDSVSFGYPNTAKRVENTTCKKRRNKIAKIYSSDIQTPSRQDFLCTYIINEFEKLVSSRPQQ